ncbi:MAG: S26 family signal peptidase [Rhodomicrobiaceae bacterium]
MRPRLIFCVTGLAVAAILIKPAMTPLYLLNLSSSVPVGLYRLEGGNPHRGSLAVIRLSEPWRDLAASRGYLPPDASLIKPVAALAGDHVCRSGAEITINGRLAAFAQQADKNGRVLPEWAGCKTLVEGELFLLSNAEGSFDGRYFGVTPQSRLIGNAVPVSGRAGK